MLRCTPQTWKPTPASPSQATRRSHQRTSDRSRSFVAIGGMQQQHTACRRYRHRREHRRVMKGATKVQQRRLCRGSQQAKAADRAQQTTRRQAQHAGAPRWIVAHGFGRTAQQAGEQHGRGCADRRTIEQVLPRRSAWTLEHVVDVEGGAEQAGQRTRAADHLTRPMCHRSLVGSAMRTDRQGQGRDDQRHEHGRIAERAAIVLDRTVQQD